MKPNNLWGDIHMHRANLLSLDIVQVVSNKAVGQHINSLVKGRICVFKRKPFYKKIPFKSQMGVLKTLGLNKQAENWSFSLTRKVLIERQFLCLSWHKNQNPKL